MVVGLVTHGLTLAVGLARPTTCVLIYFYKQGYCGSFDMIH